MIAPRNTSVARNNCAWGVCGRSTSWVSAVAGVPELTSHKSGAPTPSRELCQHAKPTSGVSRRSPPRAHQGAVPTIHHRAHITSPSQLRGCRLTCRHCCHGSKHGSSTLTRLGGGAVVAKFSDRRFFPTCMQGRAKWYATASVQTWPGPGLGFLSFNMLMKGW